MNGSEGARLTLKLSKKSKGCGDVASTVHATRSRDTSETEAHLLEVSDNHAFLLPQARHTCHIYLSVSFVV